MSAGRIKVAAVQTNPKLFDKKGNVRHCLKLLETAASHGARLIVYPECALTGYCYESAAEAVPDAEPVPGPSTDRFAEACRRLGVHAIFGLVEQDGDRLANTAALVGPDGYIGKYRKSHLPWEWIDRFATPGDELPVFDTPIGRIGIQICFDLRFPEPARVLALRGAQIICDPTNWPAGPTPSGGGSPQADFMVRARAAENRVFVIAADRVGTERGATFVGASQIAGLNGELLAKAGVDEEEIIYAEIEPAQADQKDLIFEPGQYELHLWRTRNPDLYRPIADPAFVDTVAKV